MTSLFAISSKFICSTCKEFFFSYTFEFAADGSVKPDVGCSLDLSELVDETRTGEVGQELPGSPVIGKIYEEIAGGMNFFWLFIDWSSDLFDWTIGGDGVELFYESDFSCKTCSVKDLFSVILFTESELLIEL